MRFFYSCKTRLVRASQVQWTTSLQDGIRIRGRLVLTALLQWTVRMRTQRSYARLWRTVLFAGEATDYKYQGELQAAYLSGVRAAASILG